MPRPKKTESSTTAPADVVPATRKPLPAAKSPAVKSAKTSAVKKSALKEVKSPSAGKVAPKKVAAKTVRKPKAPKPAKPMDPEEVLVRLCAEAAFDKKAVDPVILDMRGLSSFTDFFLIVSGTSEPQLKAIAASIREKVREALGRRPQAEDGFPVSQWVVIDYGTVIIHIFHAAKRAIYDLEHLWGDAPRIEVSDSTTR